MAILGWGRGGRRAQICIKPEKKGNKKYENCDFGWGCVGGRHAETWSSRINPRINLRESLFLGIL